MNSLLTELHDAQRARNDLLKWKLIVVAALGGAGLGLSQASISPRAPLALALIPLTCVYVDLLCRNLSIRTKTISAFMAREGVGADASVEARYARFYQSQTPTRGPALESLALFGQRPSCVSLS